MTTLTLVLDNAVARLKSLTNTNDKSQYEFLCNLDEEPAPLTKLTSLLNFLVNKVGEMSQEKQTAEEELRISENRAARLLLHLQQNVKLLARVATGEGETTLLQESAQNAASLSEFDASIASDYLRQMKRALECGKDRLTGVEVLELLKQEISMNAIMRKQTERLFETSRRLSAAVSQLRRDLSTRVSVKASEKVLGDIMKVTGLEPDSLVSGITKVMNENVASKRTCDLLKKKCLALKQEADMVESKFKAEVERSRQEEGKIREARVALLGALGIQCKAASEIDALNLGVSKVLPLIRQSEEISQLLGVDMSHSVEALKRLIMDNEALKMERIQKRSNDGQCQSETASLLKTPSMDTGSMADESSPMDAASDEHVHRISHLQDQFMAIERELEEIQRQMSK